ncbi:MAG: preprotein translocase subunit TatB [Candidatus Syntrophonatronum acetioxidans]|uniref:Preprotein translocase subunit TatB n=1 Tax=Candidatus Syntrophonatronum acetioxidans TaxID=1795816 RepID=A0A424YDB9_9FIRM|nr:MAG: preprotein translocase subunit TatB [Candidatus Syntrophonatronum acetioxidans]
MDSSVVDTRGLSCPQPVIKTINEIKKGEKKEITVLVDSDTARENISRALDAQGWKVLDVQPEDSGYKIKIGKK